MFLDNLCVCTRVLLFYDVHSGIEQKQRDLCEFSAVLHRDFQASRAVQ